MIYSTVKPFILFIVSLMLVTASSLFFETSSGSTGEPPAPPHSARGQDEDSPAEEIDDTEQAEDSPAEEIDDTEQEGSLTDQQPQGELLPAPSEEKPAFTGSTPKTKITFSEYKYNDALYGFSMIYPSDWTIIENVSAMSVEFESKANGGATVFVEPDQNLSLEEYASSTINHYSGRDFEVVSGPSYDPNKSSFGLIVQTRDGNTKTESEIGDFRIIHVVMKIGKDVFYNVLILGNNDPSEIMSSEALKMLKSFRITGQIQKP